MLTAVFIILLSLIISYKYEFIFKGYLLLQIEIILEIFNWQKRWKTVFACRLVSRPYRKVKN